jgi:hypothetical protein
MGSTHYYLCLIQCGGGGAGEETFEKTLLYSTMSSIFFNLVS